MGLGLNRVVPAWGMENNKNKKRPPMNRGIVMGAWLLVGSAWQSSAALHFPPGLPKV